jgi:hypothetical protein
MDWITVALLAVTVWLLAALLTAAALSWIASRADIEREPDPARSAPKPRRRR